MKKYHKTMFGSIITFVIGTSCCWISSLAIWIGGAALFGTITTVIESYQMLLLLASIVFASMTVYLYRKMKREQ